MAKGQQRSNKEKKKPKRDKTPAKPVAQPPVVSMAATVVPDHRKKK